MKVKPEKNVILSVQLPEKMVDWLDERAREKQLAVGVKVTRSDVVRALIEAGMKHGPS